MPAIGRRAAKRDGNEGEIKAALRAVGASVEELSARDIPDLLVGFRGLNILLEVKTEKGKLRPGQQEWLENWPGQSAVVRTVDEALKAIGAIE